MRAKLLGTLAVAATTLAVTAVAVAPAGAGVIYYYYGYAGGSSIRAADSTITSSLTAQAAVFGPDAGQKDDNSLAQVTAQKVLSLGTVRTHAEIESVPGGQQVTTTARIADVNLLNGLIRASAITVTTTTSRVNGVSSSTTHSDFAGLKIIGARIPVKIPQNYTLKVGNVATVAINAGKIGTKEDTSAALGAGLVVTLLKPQGNAHEGAAIYVGQTYTVVAPDSSEGTGHGTTGKAYATAIHAAAGKVVDVRSDPTVPTTVFSHGTGGQTVTNSLAAVHLSPVAEIGAVKTTGSGTNTKTVASATTSASLADIDLFDGLITAKAITVTASSSLDAAPTATAKLVDLQVGGTKIPMTVKPNTVMKLGIGKVTINQQGVSGKSVGVRALDIVLGQPAYGLPVGAEIQIAVATAAVK